ncbi:tetratricopeptide repeat protein [Hasllibacter sp. MH4015]|uniref:tetratricopeptide repeat protein n=1 Tax=Hasllibacter sp. MH4015 TaxID=2854029 RepID=UPI001CD4533E|nr:tetratricopeptide repeat protein [Hasllibacter sp. MH4015]
MTIKRSLINILVTAVFCGIPVIAVAQSSVDDLLDRLANPDLRNWEVVENDVMQRWTLSGSATADYLLRRGQEALDAEDYAAAYDHLTALVDHAPDFAEGWSTRATLFFEQQMYGPAIADLQRALALEPRHFGALAGMGIMLEDMGQYDEALEAYEAAHAIHPNQPDILRLLNGLRVQLEGEAL